METGPGRVKPGTETILSQFFDAPSQEISVANLLLKLSHNHLALTGTETPTLTVPPPALIPSLAATVVTKAFTAMFT